MPSWLSDFEVRGKVIHVKSTGAQIPLDFEIAHEVLSWFPFFIVEKFKRLGRTFSQRDRLKIAYTPVVPRPWYLLWVTAHRAGAKTVKDFATADAIFYFEDKTIAAPPKLPDEYKAKSFNFACDDISKSRVGKVFEQVFGYNLAIDPETYTGPIAVKSEKNGAHDGYEAIAPVPCEPDMVYQRLIDNTVDGKWAEDLRCPIIGGDVHLVFVKRRALKTRFANTNASVVMRAPKDLLTTEERAKLKTFAKAMGLDWGGMDVLRDKQDGRIYVVDVNKTDMGPPIALPMKDKNKATAILTAQLVALIKSRAG